MQKNIVTVFLLCLSLSILAGVGLDDMQLSLISQRELRNIKINKSVMEEIGLYYPVCFLEDMEYFKYRTANSRLNVERKVYYDQEDKVYIKIWHKEYIFRPYFLNAVRKKFYNDIAPLKSIVFDKQYVCRGYITYALDEYRPYCNYLIISNGKIAPLRYQNDTFKFFLNTLQQKTLATGLIYYDLTENNITYDGSNYFLVDLEPVLDIQSCKKNILGFNASLEYNQPEYTVFVKKVLSGAIRCETREIY